MFRLRRNVSSQKSRFTKTQRILIVALSLGLVLSGVAFSTSAAFRAKLGLAKPAKPETVQQPQAPKSERMGTDLRRVLNAGKAARALSLAPPVAPTVTATKTDSLFADADSDNQADPGDTIKYTVNISASGQDATGVTFTDNVDPNTAFVPGSLTATPVAVDDTYSALGNVRISVAAPGVLGNDFTGVPAATITGAPATSANGGNVTLNADGSFTYNPPAGFEGTDTFTYTLTNASGSNNATVTITVSGMIWFINNTASCPCDGRLTNPYNTLSSFQAVNDGVGNHPAANDNIFVYESAIDYVGPVTLLNGQKFIGQDATASLSSITGLTPPPESDPLPTMNSANATVANITSATTGITVASGNRLTGFTGGNAATDISGTGFGTLTISDVTLNGTGQALNLTNGTLAATFVSISSTNSATTGISLTSVAGTLTSPTTTLTNPTGIGLTVNTSSGSLNFGNTNASASGSTGVSLTTNTGTITFGSLSISPDASQRGLLATDNTNTITSTSGDISTTTGIAVQITRASGTTPLAISLTSVSSSGATNGIILTNTSGSFTVAGNGSTANSGGIITQSTGSANNADPNGRAVLLKNASNVTLRFMKVSVTTGNASAIDATDISGTNSIEKSLIDFNNSAAGVAATAWGLRVFNTNKNTTVNVDATTFQNKTDGATATSYSINGNSQVSVNVTDNNTADTFDSKYTGLSPSGIVMGCGDDAGSTAKCFFNVSNSKFINAPANGINDLEMAVQQSATLVPNISNNTFDKVGLASAVVGLINVNTTGSGRLGDNSNNALFSGNTITNSQSTSPTFAYTPGGNQGYLGMRFAIDGNAGVNDKVKILNNNIRVMARQGILISARTSRNDVNFLVDGNTVGTAAQPVATSNRRGIEVETQSAASLKIQVSNNVSIASAGTSNTNSSLHLRAGTGGSDTGTLFATVTGNNITNSNAVNTGGRFKAETVSVGSGSICLDLANNTLDAATKEFNLVHASSPPGVFNFRNGGGNVGTVTTSGTITSIASGCSTPVLVKSFAPNSSGSSFAEVAAEESESAGGPSAPQIAWNPNPSTSVLSPEDGKNILQVLGGERPDESSTPQLTQAELNANVFAAIQRLTDAGLSEAELANLQQLTFEVANLPDDQLAVTDGNAVRVDATAAGYGWFSDATPLEDSEFDVLVPDKERQASESSPAFGKIDLLTVVMRQLRMAAGEVSSEGAARWLTQGTLPAGTRRAPAFAIPEAAKAKPVPNAKQSATIARTTEKRKDNVQQIASTNTPRNARVLRNHATRTPMSFADVMLNIGTLPAGESVTITFNATVNNPFTSATPQVSNQGTVSGSNFADVLTDDPSVGGAADPTVTPIDLPSVSVAVSPGAVLEDGATNLVYTFTRTGSTANAQTINFNVGGTASFTQPDYTQSGAATFTATNGTVTFTAGNATASVTIDPSADTTVEPDETVSLTVTSGIGYTVGSPSSASGTITNDDTDVSVAVSPASVTEDGATNLTYTFTRVGVTSSALTVNFSVAVGGSNATFPVDYSQSGATTFAPPLGSVTFSAGSSTAIVTVDPTPDLLVEPDETVSFTVTSGAGYNVASPSSATGTITNDDADVTVTVAPSSVTEDGPTNLVYTFTRTGFTALPVTVNFSVGGTAVFSQPDYTQAGAATYSDTSGTVVFGAGQTIATVIVDPSADTTVEPDETVILTVTSGVGYNVGSPDSATGTIINDDTDVSVTVSPSSVAEDGATNLVYTFTRAGVTSNSLTVNFSVGGSANFGSDYSQSGAVSFTPTTGTVTFSPGNSTAAVTIDPSADSTVEPDETVDLTVTAGAGYNVGSPSAASGTIINDDTDVSVAVSPASVAEDGATNLTYTFSRVGVTTNTLTVNFSVGGSAGFGSDYSQSGAASFTPTTGTVTFSPGSSTAAVTIDPSADSTVEPDETVNLTLTAGSGYNVGSPSSAIGTIINDDTDVSVAVSPSSVAEDGATNLTYTFSRVGVTANSLTVNFSVGGSAGFGSDYSQSGAASFTPTTGTVTFSPGNSTAVVTIDPSADSTVEPDETVDLTVTAGAGYNVGSPSAASGTIINDDTDVSVAVSPASVSEDGATNLVYTFTRAGVTSNSLTVNFSVGGSAGFGSDYSQSGAASFTPTTGTVTFSPGSSTAAVTIDPSADSTVEPDETVDLTVTAGAGYSASPAPASGTITNDDTDVSIAVSPASVAEDGATNLVYTFTRAGVTSNSLAVNFAVGGSATFGVSPNDYTQSGATTFSGSSGTVTFGAGNSTASVTINPETDTVIEPDETVSLTLTAGSGYNVSSPSSATGTITNDDADVSVTVSPAAVAEDGATNLVYTFNRSGFTAGALTVNFSVGGTATFGVSPNDYTQTGATSFTTTTGSVTFAPGSSTAQITVDPEADTTFEPDETVIITLNSGAGYNAVSPNSATGTILNDDTLVSVVVSPTSTAEGGAPLVYTFTRTGPTAAALTANFSIGGSASFPADYTQSGATTFSPPNGTVTFGVGSSTATVTVTPLTDCLVEGSETVDFTVRPGTGYGVGSPSSASGTITNTPDSTAPTITLIPNVNMTLWPPNHQYVSVSVTDFVASASDNCDPTVNVNSVYITKITSDEVENGNGDGNTLNDIVIGGTCKTAQLRAERDGSADGRVYTIFFSVKDSAGNVATATTTVTVRKNPATPAVDSGPHYTVNSTCP